MECDFPGCGSWPEPCCKQPQTEHAKRLLKYVMEIKRMDKKVASDWLDRNCGKQSFLKSDWRTGEI